MNIIKKTLAIMISVLLLLSLPATASDENEPQTNKVSDWAARYIYDSGKVYNILPESMSGIDYTSAITRGEFSDLAYNVMRYIALYMNSDFPKSPDSPVTSFKDTENYELSAFCRIYILKNADDVDGIISRDEAASILAYIAGYFKLQKFENKLIFTDTNADYVDVVCGMGIMNGTGGGSFGPNETFTAEQSIATMIRLIYCVPYMNNCEEITENRRFIFNNFHLWVEDENGRVIFELPYYNQISGTGYGGIKFVKKDDRLLGAAFINGGTDIYDIEKREMLLSVPSTFYSLTADGKNIIVYSVCYYAPTVDAAYEVYGVYEFTGKELVPVGEDWLYLCENGYVNIVL